MALKKIRIIIPVLIICILFSGCSFRIASSVDDLIAPVAPSGENENVQNALNSFCKGGFSLKRLPEASTLPHILFLIMMMTVPTKQ